MTAVELRTSYATKSNYDTCDIRKADLETREDVANPRDTVTDESGNRMYSRVPDSQEFSIVLKIYRRSIFHTNLDDTTHLKLLES